MIRFIIGLIFGIIIGALAVLVFSALGAVGNPLAYTPLPGPGQPVIHITVDAPYLNQQLVTVLDSQPQLAGGHPQLTLQSPNVAILTSDVQVNANGNTLKLRPTIKMQFQVENGRVKTQVVSVSMGTLNVPNALIKTQVAQMESTLEDQVNNAIGSALSGSGLKLYAVSTSPAGLTVDLGE